MCSSQRWGILFIKVGWEWNHGCGNGQTSIGNGPSKHRMVVVLVAACSHVGGIGHPALLNRHDVSGNVCRQPHGWMHIDRSRVWSHYHFLIMDMDTGRSSFGKLAKCEVAILPWYCFGKHESQPPWNGCYLAWSPSNRWHVGGQDIDDVSWILWLSCATPTGRSGRFLHSSMCQRPHGAFRRDPLGELAAASPPKVSSSRGG